MQTTDPSSRRRNKVCILAFRERATATSSVFTSADKVLAAFRREGCTASRIGEGDAPESRGLLTTFFEVSYRDTPSPNAAIAAMHLPRLVVSSDSGHGARVSVRVLPRAGGRGATLCLYVCATRRQPRRQRKAQAAVDASVGNNVVRARHASTCLGHSRGRPEELNSSVVARYNSPVPLCCLASGLSISADHKIDFFSAVNRRWLLIWAHLNAR